MECLEIAPAAVEFSSVIFSIIWQQWNISTMLGSFHFYTFTFQILFFPHQCRCGLLHILQRQSNNLLKTSSNKSYKHAVSQTAVVILCASCLFTCCFGRTWGFTVSYVRNHEAKISFGHMFIIFWEAQIQLLGCSQFILLWLCCGVRVMQRLWMWNLITWHVLIP